jgi:hypothetical protein
MIVRVDSWLHRLIFRLPVFLPSLCGVLQGGG